MGRNSRRIKDRLEEIEEGYQDARDDAFNDEFVDFITGTPEDNKLTEEDVQGFMDSFTFEDEADWCWTQLNNEEADIGDQKYQQWKDEK